MIIAREQADVAAPPCRSGRRKAQYVPGRTERSINADIKVELLVFFFIMCARTCASLFAIRFSLGPCAQTQTIVSSTERILFLLSADKPIHEQSNTKMKTKTGKQRLRNERSNETNSEQKKNNRQNNGLNKSVNAYRRGSYATATAVAAAPPIAQHSGDTVPRH